MWWEYDNYEPVEPEAKKKGKRMKCPVCKAYFGIRYETEFFLGHCDECKTTFSWTGTEDTPSSKLDCKSHNCGCGHCGR